MENTLDAVSRAHELFTYPTALEMKAAQAACCGKCCLSCETPAAYAWRRRDVDMALLLRRAMEEELTETERENLRLIYFEGLSLTLAAGRLGVSPSAVSRTAERARRKLYSALKYAVYYQRSTLSETTAHSAVRRAAVIAAAMKASPKEFSGRLAALRVSENLSVNALAGHLKIEEIRLAKLENGSEQPTVQELAAISAYFGISTDYLIKGDVNGNGKITRAARP